MGKRRRFPSGLPRDISMGRGGWFELHGASLTKRTANKKANALKKRGFTYRVVKDRGYTSSGKWKTYWCVYRGEKRR